MRIKYLREEKGFILVIALMMLLVLTLIGIGSVNTSTYELLITGNYRVSEEAFYAADAGIQDGINRIVKKVISDAGSEDLTTWNSGVTYATSGFNNSFTVTHLSGGGVVVEAPNGNPYYLLYKI